MDDKQNLTLRINDARHEIRVAPRKTLADAIREDCGLTGTHTGWEHGVCGACTGLVDGDPIRSCLMFAVQAVDRDIRTVEGLADGDILHPLQQAFIDHHALQCGFCTAGFLMTGIAFLNDTPQPTEAQVREAIAGNICRCSRPSPEARQQFCIQDAC